MTLRVVQANETLLRAIASQPSVDNYVYAGSYDSLDTVKTMLLSKTCLVRTTVRQASSTAVATTVKPSTSTLVPITTSLPVSSTVQLTMLTSGHLPDNEVYKSGEKIDVQTVRHQY